MQGLASLAIAGVLVGRARTAASRLGRGRDRRRRWLIGFVNAFNFMDGVNGISAAHALIGGAAYACLGCGGPDAFLAARRGRRRGRAGVPALNAVRARVFLGDAGSYGLGVALAVLAAYSVLRGIPDRGARSPRSGCTWRTPDGHCSGASGLASGFLKPTGRTPTSSCVTWAGHTSGSRPPRLA